MKAKEFYKENEGKYFMYRGNKVRVVGVDVSNNRDYVIITYLKGWVIEDRFNNFSIKFFIDFSLCEKESKFYYVKSSDLIQIEQTELNLCEILEGCEGITLYSPVFGDVILTSINKCLDYPITVSLSDKCSRSFYKDGLYLNGYSAECMLFPSKENRDWSTFKKTIKIKEGTPVMCFNGINNHWTLFKYNEGIKTYYNYIVPATEFDFTDFDSNKSKSII